MGKPVVATFSTNATPTIRITRGELWDSDDQLVQAHPDWFTDDPESVGLLRRSGPPATRVVETATAGPGEKRDLSLPPAGDTRQSGRTTSRKASETRG